MNGRQECVSFNIQRARARTAALFFILVTKVSKELSASSKYHPSARARQRDVSPVCDFRSAARLVHIFVHSFRTLPPVNNTYLCSFSSGASALLIARGLAIDRVKSADIVKRA